MKETKKVVVTGAGGLIGSALVRRLTAQGYRVTRLVRSAPPKPKSAMPKSAISDSGAVEWHPETGVLDPAALEGYDAVIHLAGESIAQRWTPASKERIRASRVETTRLLCATLAGLAQPPQVLVSASAIGYYGDRGDDVLHEDSAPGHGFLPAVCRAWEAATEPASACGIRVVRLRLGIVLSAHGGALANMLRPFRLGLGGTIGSGRQFWSWITLEDTVGVIEHALGTSRLQGAVNAVAPHPVRNQEFTRALGRVLGRPTLLPVPAFALRLALGQEMATELLLASARVAPAQLQATGYAFHHPELDGALRDLLAAPPRPTGSPR